MRNTANLEATRYSYEGSLIPPRFLALHGLPGPHWLEQSLGLQGVFPNLGQRGLWSIPSTASANSFFASLLMNQLMSHRGPPIYKIMNYIKSSLLSGFRTDVIHGSILFAQNNTFKN